MKDDKQVFLSLSCLCILTGCVSTTTPRGTETQRVTSPHKEVDAVLMENWGRGTNSHAASVFIVPIGAKVRTNNPVFVADGTKNLTIQWTAGKVLEIRYTEAAVIQYRHSHGSHEEDPAIHELFPGCGFVVLTNKASQTQAHSAGEKQK